jgi:hypothetical protein
MHYNKHSSPQNLTVMTTIINVTPHGVTIVDSQGTVLKQIPASGTLVRLKSETVTVGSIDGIPTSSTMFSDVTGLPDFQTDTFFIVSQLVKSALPNRTDLLVPAQVVRDDKGNIIGCQSLGI